MNDRLIIVEVPHRGPATAYSISLALLRREVYARCDIDTLLPGRDDAPLTLDECVTCIGHDLAAIDVWTRADATRLAAQTATAERHGDPVRTLRAQRLAERLGWISENDDGTWVVVEEAAAR